MTDKLQEYTSLVFTPTHIRQALQSNGLALKKSFGQNFLINPHAARRSLAYAGLHSEDSVLEIGPGLGALTVLLAELVEEVVAIEIDRGLAALLSRTLRGLGCDTVAVVHGDFLSLDLKILPFSKAPTHVVSNFPYSIAVKAIIRIAEELGSVQCITGMIQRELADRIGASPGSKQYSFVSVYLQHLMEIKVPERSIGPTNFFPNPEVDSAIVIFRRRRKPEPDDQLFKHVVKRAFSNRRKRLVKNIQQLPLCIPSADVEHIVCKLFNNPGIRAEELSVSAFQDLTEALKPLLTS